jgi:hypothetical protein
MIGAVGYKVITLNRNQKELYPTMNTFSKKSLHVALAGLSTLGLAGAAEAVMVNPNGLGQVLIYPYYTVRNGYNVGGVSAAPFATLLSIVNTTNSTKSVKVRFREGKASKEVLDFNVFLSPYDMWTAAVEPDGAGGAMIETADNSCTIPSFTKNVGVPFRQTLLNDAIGASADRLTEGYFEVFEMATYDSASPVGVGAIHAQPAGIPTCAGVTDANGSTYALPPQGGLSGGATLVNVLTGDAFTEDATALTQFTDTGSYSNTGVATPDFTDTFPTVGAAVNGLGQIVSGTFGGLTAPIKAATAALQRTSVINEFVLDKSTLSGTDWVITFPTKHNHLGGTLPPFQSGLGAKGSCDDIGIAVYNREEGPPGSTPGTDFSPLPPGQTGPALCWESNILTFNNSNVLGSANSYNIALKAPDWPDAVDKHGWMKLTFTSTAATTVGNQATSAVVYDPLGTTTSPTSTTFAGLPTIGFAVQTFVNGTLANGNGSLVQSSYGGNFGHRYTGPQ